VTFQRIFSPSEAAKLATLVARGRTKVSLAKEYGVSVNTIRRTINREEKEPRELLPCGTDASYQRHRRKGEKCPECSYAHAVEVQRYKQLQKWRRSQEDAS
jgi:transposase